MEQVLQTLKMRIQDIYIIFDHYGEAAQVLKTLEELSECTAAINQNVVTQFISTGGIDQHDEIALTSTAYSEIADALIMLVQIAAIDPETVSKAIDYKIDRTLKRMESEVQG